MSDFDPDNLPRLDEYGKEDWFDVMRLVRPEITRAEFDAHWERFHAMKLARQAQRELN